MLDKPALRQRARRLRHEYVQSLTLDARSALHVALADRVVERLDPGSVVASYVAAGSEIDPRAIDRRALKLGFEIAYPWFTDRDAAMLFRRGDSFVAGPFGIPQPGAEGTLLVPDIVLVPMLAADTQGTRLGQGKGHYDRALATLLKDKPLFTIGLAYDMQIADELPRDDWDIPLDAIATPTRWIDILP